MNERLEQVKARLEELDRQMMSPEVVRDNNRMREVGQERAHLVPILEAYQDLQRATRELEETRELMEDPEMREVAAEEHRRIEEELPVIRARLQAALLPPDPYEGRDIILEIRAGTGGDEAALFAADLFRMYTRYCESHRWKVEVLDASDITVGGASGKTALGYREIICQISGADAYRHLKYESGVHRVQRVPLTETQGRIHTSAATVAILPVAEAVEIDLPEKDLRIDVYRASGPGGQSVNTTDSAVRITHLPTGMVVQCQDEKSQHKNKAKALKVLAARLLELKQAEADAVEAEARRSQVGSGDRSERIRTYNFPQNRVTDHRIGLTLYQLDRIMMGEVSDLLEGCVAHFQAEALAAAGELGV